MGSIRVYEIARELEITSKELLQTLDELDMDIKSHMSSLTQEEAETIKSLILDDSEEETEEKEEIREEEIEVLEKSEDSEVNEGEIEDKDIVEIGQSIIVREFAELLDVNVNQLIMKLMSLGAMVNQNQNIDFDTAAIVAEELGKKVREKVEKTEDIEEQSLKLEAKYKLDFPDNKNTLKPRPAVVTVMGHVDHGKTSLLDAIKHTKVTSGEAGGITQHIGAYMVDVNGEKITFLDTPGHEAFTSLRVRGTQITDIAILVIAADDGIMPQTVEAISHAKAADVPLIVAINKIDLPDANVMRAQQELLEYEIVPEDWGGDTIVVPISAKTGEGIDELLEMILLVAEMEELRANPNRTVVGTVIEAELDSNRGPTATILVQKGTLRTGDTIVSGTGIGRVRAMFNDRGENIDSAGPSVPVVVLGLSETPNAGDSLYSVANEKVAKDYSQEKKMQVRDSELKSDHKVSLDDLFERIQAGELKDLNIIVKGDVRGSIEALTQSLEKLDTDEVKVNIIHSGVGGITEGDIILASASNAIIIGFNVRPNLIAQEVAKKENVDIKTYRVIYEAIEDIENAVRGMHAPVIVEEVTGRAEVRDTFRIPSGDTVAGIYVVDGEINRNGHVRLLRDDIVVFEGDVASLRRFTDDVRKVSSGYEAGLGIEGYNDIKIGDYIEAYIEKEVQK